ncbi:MAG: hypothetical protein HYV09_07700 [Deltaproteobacteria bacterium]|nr:hypothetical protein [Deltaproteobacteria bacterium]
MPRSKPPPFPPPDSRPAPARPPPARHPFRDDDDGPNVSRATLPVPGPSDERLPTPMPADKAPTRPTGDLPIEFSAATVRPGDDKPALRRNSTDSGLGLGVPGPSFGGDTEFDPVHENPIDRLRQTSSFEHERPARRLASLSEPPAIELGFDDESDPAAEALDLVGRHADASLPAAEPSRRPDPLAELRERYALGDFSGALTIAEAILEQEPGNADAQRYSESCRDVLKQMYSARLGSLEQVPVVAVPAEQLRWLTLDHRSGFLLSHVDGVSTLEEILDISGMPHLEAMRIIYELLQQKVIVLQ